LSSRKLFDPLGHVFVGDFGIVVGDADALVLLQARMGGTTSNSALKAQRLAVVEVTSETSGG